MDIETAKMEAVDHGKQDSAFFKEYGTHGYSLLLEELIRRAGSVAAENPKLVEELRRGMRILCPWLNK